MEIHVTLAPETEARLREAADASTEVASQLLRNPLADGPLGRDEVAQLARDANISTTLWG